MALPAMVGLVTLGVSDVSASTRFYRSLGFELSSASVEGDVSFFRTAGCILALFGDDDLRRDTTDPAPPAAPGSARGVALAIFAADPAGVDDAFATAEKAGARVVKAPRFAEWGGYHAYVADPDGHLWEIAFNPHWPLDDGGLPQLPA